VERGGALARWLPDYSTTLLGFYAVIGLATTVVFGVLAVAHLVGRDPQRTLPDLSVTTLGVLYVGILGMHVLAIRGLGMAYVLIFLAAAKLGDAGAYFCGMRFGRHALAPRTSPKKTAEGAVGGLLASAVAGVLVAKAFAVNGSLGYWAGFSLAVAVAAQVGDLLESALKRSVGAKDSGGFLPTFGGILDLIDSPLLSAPVALWILAWAPPA
jgi:phosphatidate cytidylyltransferase